MVRHQSSEPRRLARLAPPVAGPARTRTTAQASPLTRMAIAEATRDDAPREEQPRGRWWSEHAGWVLTGIVALLSVPIVVALVVLHSPRWYPLLDWAQTEIRIRDVASGHPPLIGLAGRIGPFGANGGSHPGPISFYVLWSFWA